MSDKRNTLLNIVIVVLTVILFCLAGALIVKTAPRDGRQYGPETAEGMIRQIDRGSYNYLIEDKYSNELMGVYAEKKHAYTVPYAAADYFEAALNFKGLTMAGDDAAASRYREIMDRARKDMGQYTHIADDMDEFLK